MLEVKLSSRDGMSQDHTGVVKLEADQNFFFLCERGPAYFQNSWLGVGCTSGFLPLVCSLYILMFLHRLRESKNYLLDKFQFLGFHSSLYVAGPTAIIWRRWMSIPGRSLAAYSWLRCLGLEWPRSRLACSRPSPVISTRCFLAAVGSSMGDCCGVGRGGSACIMVMVDWAHACGSGWFCWSIFIVLVPFLPGS